MDTSRPLNISICILNWENYPDTAKCIRGIINLPEREDPRFNVHILVIDNGSQDESLDKLERLVAGIDYQQMHILRAAENRGYAAGNNLGIRYALDTLQSDYVWVLNNDTVPLPGSLESLADAAGRDGSVAIWGSSLIDGDSLKSQCAGGYYYNAWLGTIKPALPGMLAEQLAGRKLDRKLDYISGAAMFIRADVFESIGYLDEGYFLYCEELDFVHRLLPGMGIAWCRDSVVIHQGGASLNVKGNKRSSKAEYFSILSSLVFTRKFYPLRLLTVMPILFFGKLAVYFLTKQMRMAGTMLRAFVAFLR